MKLALPLIFNIMADHIVKWQAAKERESRTGFCWAKTWGVGFSSLCQGWAPLVSGEWHWFMWEASPSSGFSIVHFITSAVPALLAAIAQLKPCCLAVVRLFFHLYWTGFEVFLRLRHHLNGSDLLGSWGEGFFTWRKTKAFTSRLTSMQEEYLAGQRSAG